MKTHQRALPVLLLSALLASCGAPVSTPTAPTGTPGTPSAGAPAAPAGFVVTPTSSSSVTLKWTAVAGATGYIVDRKAGAAAYAQIAVLGASDTQYLDAALNPSTSYSYRLRASNTAGTGSGVEQAVTTPAPAADKADVNAFAATLPAWSAFSPPVADARTAGTQTSEPPVVQDGVTYDCTTTPYSLTATPDKLVTFSPDESVFWPGVLLQGQGYRDGLGSLKELPIRQRAPLKLSIDLLGSDTTRTVMQPDKASVSQAIGEIIQSAKDKGVPPGTSVSYTKTDTSSSEQASLDLGVSVRYLTADVKASLSASRAVDEHTITAFFIEKAFTVSVVPPQTPSGYFGDDFTQAKLDEQKALGSIGPSNIPVYLANIAYGRVLMFSMTAKGSQTDIQGAIDFSYRGGADVDVTTKAKYQKILSSATVKVATVGGDPANVISLIRTGQLDQYFASSPDLATYRPISYEVRNLGDGSIAKVSETTSYNLRQCTAKPPNPVKVGERVRVTLNFIHVYNDEDPGVDPGDVYGSVQVDGQNAFSTDPDNTISAASGSNMTFNGQTTFEKDIIFGKDSFKVTGHLYDRDGGFNGDDDDMGSWNYLIKEPFDYTHENAVQSSNGDTELRYTVTKVSDLYQ